MANSDDWLWIGLAVLAGLAIGYILESRLGVISAFLDGCLGRREADQKQIPPVVYVEKPKNTGPVKLFPNPIYDPYAIYDNAPDAWYYMY